MPANKKSIKAVLVRFSEEEFAAAEWLKNKTRRSRTNAVKWAVLKTAEDLGYMAKCKGR